MYASQSMINIETVKLTTFFWLIKQKIFKVAANNKGC